MEYEADDISLRDSCYGIVIGGCSAGLFIELENGEVAFSKFGFLKNGTQVLVTVLKKANNNLKAFVSIDTVFGNTYPMAG